MPRVKKKNSVGRPRKKPEDPGQEYASWLRLVPKDKRREVATVLASAKLGNYGNLVDFSVYIMAALMEGRITPVIAQELRAWHELNFTILATKNSVAGTPQNAHTDIIAALVHVKQTSKRLRTDYFDDVDVKPSLSPVPVRVGEKK